MLPLQLSGAVERKSSDGQNVALSYERVRLIDRYYAACYNFLHFIPVGRSGGIGRRGSLKNC